MFDRVMSMIERVIIAVSFATITFLAFANVIARYVFHASFSFTSEILINVAVLLTMFGASAVTRQGSHPAFTMLRETSRGVRQKVVTLFICAAMLVFYVLFLWLGYEMVSNHAASGRLTPGLGVPQWIFSMALPVGALFGSLRVVQAVVMTLRGDDPFKSEDERTIELAHEEAEAFAERQEDRQP